MYNGYGNYGMGRSGGNEMMIIVVCCVCCLSLLCLFGGYWFNLFCGVSKSLGKSCPADPVTEAPSSGEDPTINPVPETQPTCNTAYGKRTRSGSDPRPTLDPAACKDTAALPGRDCYNWVVDNDPVTGMARWVRVNVGDYDERSSDPSCKTEVECQPKIDFSTLVDYRENNANSLLRLCRSVPRSATTRDASINYITRKAQEAKCKTWTRANSIAWYNQCEKFIGQGDVAPYANNCTEAAKVVRRKLKSDRLSNWVFAAMLEACLKVKFVETTWIITVTNTWARIPSSNREDSYVAYLNMNVGDRLSDWRRIIDNPQRMGTRSY